MSENVPTISGFPCPDGKGIFVWASNQHDRNCLRCGKPFPEHLYFRDLTPSDQATTLPAVTHRA